MVNFSENCRMHSFNPKDLKKLRIDKGLTATEVARRMNISPAQVHRLENAARRLTVDTLIAYCEAVHISVSELFTPNIWVPVTGTIDSDFEIQAIPPSSPDRILAPPLVDNMSRVAAIRWAASQRFTVMHDHTLFYERHDKGVPDAAWDNRCLILRSNGRQCLGWPIRQGDTVYIDFSAGPVELNAEITWASPILAVMPPFALDSLVPPT